MDSAASFSIRKCKKKPDDGSFCDDVGGDSDCDMPTLQKEMDPSSTEEDRSLPNPPPHMDSASASFSIRKCNKSDKSDDGCSSFYVSPKKPRVLSGDADCDMPTLEEETDLAISEKDQKDRGMIGIKLSLPHPLQMSHGKVKEDLLKKRGLCHELQVPAFEDAELTTQLEDLVIASRILHLNEIELYFVEDGDVGPFSPRNELESLNAILSSINSSLTNAKYEKKVLQSLRSSICLKINEAASKCPDNETVLEDDQPGNELLEWERSHNMKAKLNIARCSETGRGAVASEDIGIGDIVLEVPYSRIIWEDVVEKTDMYDDLKKNGISSEEMFLAWCMVERRNPDSKHKKYFQALPEKFYTGLSFGWDALEELNDASLLVCELQDMESGLHHQFCKLCSIISCIQDEYTLEDYKWARQLLDTNGMKVVSDEKSKLCLVPVAGFFNHSLCPHILHHETLERESVDRKTKFLIFRASRPCRKGEQCYFSYGNLSGHEFVKLYGFLPKGLNPYDVLYLDWTWLIDNSLVPEHTDDFNWITPMVKGLMDHKLPARLMDHLFAQYGVAKDHRPEDIVPVIEALKTLKNHIFYMLVLFESRDLREYDEQQELPWDVKLVREYDKHMLLLIPAALRCCLNTLEELQIKYGHSTKDNYIFSTHQLRN